MFAYMSASASSGIASSAPDELPTNGTESKQPAVLPTAATEARPAAERSRSLRCIPCIELYFSWLHFSLLVLSDDVIAVAVRGPDRSRRQRGSVHRVFPLPTGRGDRYRVPNRPRQR